MGWPAFCASALRYTGRILRKGAGFFMLTIDNLTITHLRDLRTVLTDFSLQLGPGDKAVLIGEEGNGKSTLLKLIHDPALVEGYAEWSGRMS